MKTVFIFRRDLRIKDNTGLNYVFDQVKNNRKTSDDPRKNIVCVFIFTPEQIDRNDFKSNALVQFMIESLYDLQKQLKSIGIRLYFFHGTNKTVIEEIIFMFKPNLICFNKDYTPYAMKRDEIIQKQCIKYGVECVQKDDYSLINLYSILNDKQMPYSKFTSFYNRAIQVEFRKNITSKYIKRDKKDEKQDKKYESDYMIHDLSVFYKEDPQPMFRGGRSNIILKLVKENTGLSPYIKFGCLSIREALQLNPSILRSLLWRDFYSCQLLFNEDYLWKDTKIRETKTFKLWQKGLTGFPIVDASMRQLNQKGYITNRNRLIVGSFLVNDLRLSWKLGEKHFAKKLVDYDVAQNNGNWRWIFDQNDFKTLNPWRQQVIYDKKCEYIREWIPELVDVNDKDIHKWYQMYKEYDGIYVKPCI